MTPTRHRVLQFIIWGILALVILLVAAIRIRLLALPLERDEGEYAFLSGRYLWMLERFQKYCSRSAAFTPLRCRRTNPC